MERRKNWYGTVISVLVACFLILSSGSAIADTVTSNPSTVYTNTQNTNSETIGRIITQELGSTGMSNGYFTLKIPSTVKLTNAGSNTSSAGSAITRDTDTLGTVTVPKDLFAVTIGDANYGSAAICFNGTKGSNYGVMFVYSSGDSGASCHLCYGSADVSQNTASSFLGLYSNLNKVTALAAGASSSPVGKIYLDTSTNETVITMGVNVAGGTITETLALTNINVIPATTNDTGTVDFSLLGGKADGTGGDAVTDDTSVTVMSMVNQPAQVSGSTTPPTIATGAVSGQPMGQIKITKVGSGDVQATTGSNGKGVITISLDNGAAFHADATTTYGGTTDNRSIKVGSTSWGSSTTENTFAYVSQFPGDKGSLSIDSGKLVINLGSTNVAHQEVILLPATTSSVIDTSGVTGSVSITATITGSGIFSGLSATTVVATTQVKGATVSFLDDTTAGLTSIFAGRNSATIGTGEYLLIGEDAPGSLLAGGTITLTLNQGAKFNKSDVINTDAYTTSPYSSTSGLDIPNFTVSSTADSATVSAAVAGASTGGRGAEKFSSFDFDLTNATPGTLTITVSGNAGVSGSADVATIIQATSTTVSGTLPNVGQNSLVNLNDIVITESTYGALEKDTGYFILKFPATATLVTAGATPTVTTVDGTSSSSTTVVTFDSWDSTDNAAAFKVNTVSSKASGAYTITISGLQVNISSSAGSGNIAFNIGGSTAADYTGTTFGSNYGAKAWSESVNFAQVVSSTVPLVTLNDNVDGLLSVNVIPAGNNLGQVGDWYVFTSSPAKFYDGSSWVDTETAYELSAVLDSKDFSIPSADLAVGTRVFVGYGVGVSSTFTNLNSNGTFGIAYTVPEPTVFTVTPETANLKPGDAATITISGGTPDYTIESSDTAVATVDNATLNADGTVTVTVASDATAGATATITVTDSSETPESKTVAVTVISADELTLTSSATTATAGDTFTLTIVNGTAPFTLTASPSDAVTDLPDEATSDTTVTVTAGTVSSDTDVEFTVTDNESNTASVTVSITPSSVVEPQPVPTEPTPPEDMPLETDEEIAAAPVSVGTVTDGKIEEIQLAFSFPPYEEAVDIYVAIAIPRSTGELDFFFVNSNGDLVAAIGEFPAYATDTTEAISTTIFDSFAVCTPFGPSVPQGQWYVFYLIAPTTDPAGDITAAMEGGAYILKLFGFTVSCE